MTSTTQTSTPATTVLAASYGEGSLDGSVLSDTTSDTDESETGDNLPYDLHHALSELQAASSSTTQLDSKRSLNAVHDDAAKGLLHVLSKWKRREYTPEVPFMAHILQHQYTSSNLTSGAAALKAPDAQCIAHLRSLANELGFTVGLANLETRVHGTTDYRGSRDEPKGRYGVGSYGLFEELPEMDDVEGTDNELSDVVSLDGRSFAGKATIIPKEWIIPSNPFKKDSPDDFDYQPSVGESPGSLQHWYYRSVMWIFDEQNKDQAMAALGSRPSWGIIEFAGRLFT